MGQARDYEALIRELLVGVAGGWSHGNVTDWLICKDLKDRDLTQWLRENVAALGTDELVREQLGHLAGLGWRELTEAAKMVKEWEPQVAEWNEWEEDWEEDWVDFEGFDNFEWLEPWEECFNRGNELLELDKYEEAISSLDKAIELNPDYYQAWNGRGEAMHHLERYKEAIHNFDRAIEINSDHRRLWTNRGHTMHKLGRYEEAIHNFDRAIEIDSGSYIDCLLRGITLNILGRYEDALSSVNRSIEVDPDFSPAWHLQCYVLSNLKRYKETLSICDRIIKVDPNDYEIWSIRSSSLNNLERYDDSIASSNRAIKIKSDDHIVWDNRCTAIGNLHGYQAKINIYNEAFQYISFDTKPEGWGYLQCKIGSTHYKEGINQLFNYRRNPQPYYYQALTSYKKALKSLTREEFPKLRLDTLIDIAKVYLAQHNISAAHQCKTEALDILRDLLNAQPTFEGKKRLQIEYSSLSQLDVDLFIANGDNINALVAAELDKNNRLTWLLSALAETTVSPAYTQMQQLLTTEQTSIVYWHLSPDNLTTFILTANDSQPLVWESDRRQQAQQLSKWIKEWDSQYRDYGSKKSVETKPSFNGEVIKDEKEHHPWRKNLPDYLAQLQQILEIDKICAQLPTTLTHLILIPHGDLHRFPLHTLFLASANLPNLQSCTYLPSIQIGLNLQQRSNPTKSYTPLLSVEDPETHQDKMPFAQIESTIVRHLLQPNTHINSASAKLATVENALRQPHASFHFTGHAAYNSRSPEASALALTDEPLTAKRISQLDLSSYNLITLAACETAITGRENINTEYVGLTSAFLQAGAANILSTLWQVDEIANAWFTIYFYQQLLNGKLPAEALAITQRWLQTVTWQNLADWLTEISQLPQLEIGIIDRLTARITNILKEGGTISLDLPTKYSHPYYWAAFTLTGEG